MIRTNILRFIETGLSCSCLEQLGWFAGRNPKDCTVGYITENPPVPSTLGFGGWWRSKRSNFLSLDGWRWSCLNFWLLSRWGLNLLGQEKCRASLWKKKKKRRKKWKRKTNQHSIFSYKIWMAKAIKAREKTKATAIRAATETDTTKALPGS